MAKIRRCWSATLALVAVSFLALSVANAATAKGPILISSPVSINLHANGVSVGSLQQMTRAQIASVSNVIADIPRLYNASWKTAIHDFASKNGQPLQGQWIDHIYLSQNQTQRNGASILAVWFDVVSGGTNSQVVHYYPGDQTLVTNLKELNATLAVNFSVYGPDFIPSAIDELFSQTDSYFQGLSAVTGQISQTLQTQFPGRYFSWVTINLLDPTTVRLDSSSIPSSVYYGLKLPTIQTIVTTVALTVSRSESGSAAPNYNYTIGGIGIAALGGALLVVMISRKMMS